MPTFTYRHPNLKISPRKLRPLTRAIYQSLPSVSLNQLKFTNSKAARILTKALQTAIHNAVHHHHFDPASLQFDQIRVDEGPKFKRMDKSHGSRFARGIIQKRHSRLSISLKGKITNEAK